MNKLILLMEAHMLRRVIAIGSWQKQVLSILFEKKILHIFSEIHVTSKNAECEERKSCKYF